jgi:trehalose 6-phosphate synthase
MVLLSHHGPVSSGRDESGRTASRGAGGPVTALIGANVGPPRRRLGMRATTDEDPAVVGEHDHKVFSATLEPEPRLLDQADVRGC